MAGTGLKHLGLHSLARWRKKNTSKGWKRLICENGTGQPFFGLNGFFFGTKRVSEVVLDVGCAQGPRKDADVQWLLLVPLKGGR